MEKSILVEGNHQGDSTLASKSSKALIKIDSISIDLVNANEKNVAEKCEHFSIRGYVAEIRKKDRKICWPFSIAGKHNKLDEQICTLPPLDVTKFRWWRCQNCLHEIDAEGTAKEIGMVPNCCNTGCKSTSTCSHMSSHHDAAMLPSDFQHASKLDSNVGRKADANTSAYVDSDPYLPSCNDEKEEKEKKAEVVWTTIMGPENGSNVDANQEILRPTCAATMFNPCQMRERHTDDTVVLKLKCNGLVESCKPNCGIHEVAENGLVIKDLKCMDNSSTDIGETEKGISVDDQHKDTITALGTSGVVCELNGPSFAAKVHTNEQSSLELDTRDYASSEGDEILVENDLQDQHHDNSGGFHHRKTQKVRLLTELLGANGNENAGHIRIENAPSNTSAGVDSPSISQVQVAVEGNIGRGFKGQNKKRKMPRDEDWRPPEMICPNNVNKKVKTFKGDAENTAVAVASSKAEEDSFTGIVSQAGTKNHLTLHGFDGNLIPMKKKLKKTQADDGCSCLVPLREVVCKENPEKYGVADKSTTAHNDAFKGRVVDPLLKNFLPAQRTVRNSSLYKKKNKMPQVENMQASLRARNDGMLRKGPIMGQNVEIMQTGPELVSFKSVQGAAAGIGSYLSLESYLAAQNNNRKFGPQIENGLDSLLPWHEVTFREDQTMRKDVGIKHVGESSVPLKSVADARVEKGGHCDLNLKKTTHGTSLRSKKQNCTSLVEDGDCSLMWKTDFSGTSNNEKTIAVQEHPEVTKKHSDQRADKMFEQGALDDIPMEIVELMAKNQYERRLQDTENNYCPLGTTYRPRNGETMDFAELYGNGTSRVLQEENPHLRKPQPRNARKGIFTTGENVGPAKQKSIGYFPIVGHPEGTHASRGFGAFSQCREQLSSEVQFCAPGSSRHIGAQNCNWDGDTLGNRFSPPSSQAFKAYDTCQTVSKQSEKAAGVWSSMIPNHIPYGLNIPPSCAPQSINIDMISQAPGTMHKGKMNGNHDVDFLNLNVANLEKQHRNFSSETFNKIHAEYPYVCNHKGTELHPKLMGSLDIYSNETIPAMHLLSLMDAGMRSTPFNMDGDTKFLKRSSFPHDYRSKEFSEMDIGVYKTNHASRHLSSDYYRKNHLSEKSCECSPAIPTVSAFASFQNDVNFRRTAGLTGQVPLKPREKGKAKCSYSPTQNRGRKSQKSVSTSIGLGKNRESIPVLDTQKRFLGASDFMLCPSQCRTIENSTKCVELEAHSSYGTVWPVKSCSETEICSINRNPADFSIPEAGNAYTIGAEDLKFGKTICSEDRSGLISIDGHKRQRIMKLTAVKGRALHQVS